MPVKAPQRTGAVCRRPAGALSSRAVVGSCYACGAAFDAYLEIFRATTCPSCGKDAHVCLNCRFYDTSAHMECREPIAEPVGQKDRANFCEYFKVREGAGSGPAAGGTVAGSTIADRAREAAERLFGDR